jgi:hypothetical protein
MSAAVPTTVILSEAKDLGCLDFGYITDIVRDVQNGDIARDHRRVPGILTVPHCLRTFNP